MEFWFNHRMVRELVLLALVICLNNTFSFGDSLIVPRGKGLYSVGTTNFQVAETYQNATRSEMDRFLGGSLGSGNRPVYVDQILRLETAQAATISVEVPDNRSLYGSLANSVFPLSYFVVYPTREDNAQEDYVFPFAGSSDTAFTKMDEPGEALNLADPTIRYPMIVVTPGYNSHSIYEVSAAKFLASHGYIVVCLFPGDGRFAGNYPTLGKRAVRPLQVKALLDELLENPRFAESIDRERIGVLGSSYGGMAVAAVLGALIDGNFDSVVDSRIRAGIGVVPWFGDTQVAGPAHTFGADDVGVVGMDRPFMSLYGTADINAPSRISLPALRRSNGTVYAIELVGQGHSLDSIFYQDIAQWELLFFDGYLKDDENALEILKDAQSVEGFGDDRQQFEYQKVLDTPLASIGNVFGLDDPYIGLRLVKPSSDQSMEQILFFPSRIEEGIGYDLQRSLDMRSWQTLRSREVSVELGNWPPIVLPNTHRWSAFMNTIGFEDMIQGPYFLRVRASVLK